MDLSIDSHFDINKLKDISDNFRSRLDGLEKMSTNGRGKVGVYNDHVYLSWNWFQGFQRTFYGENREKNMSYIYKTFDEYFIFYKMLESAWLYEKSLELDKERLTDATRLRKLNCEQMEKWYSGLGYLSKQYEGERVITEKLEEIREKIYEILKPLHCL